jgi:hypothetical protein
MASPETLRRWGLRLILILPLLSLTCTGPLYHLR